MRKKFLFGILLSCAVLSNGAMAARYNPNPSSTISYNGTTYKYSSTSTCSNGTAALRYQRKWWCPTTTATMPTTSTPVATAPVTRSAQLSWSLPTTRANGKALSLSELSGYELYYTNDSGSVAKVVPVAGGTTSTTTVANLTTGNYSFSISAIDAAGLKSALSTVVTIKVP